MLLTPCGTPHLRVSIVEAKAHTCDVSERIEAAAGRDDRSFVSQRLQIALNGASAYVEHLGQYLDPGNGALVVCLLDEATQLAPATSHAGGRIVRRVDSPDDG